MPQNGRETVWKSDNDDVSGSCDKPPDPGATGVAGAMSQAAATPRRAAPQILEQPWQIPGRRRQIPTPPDPRATSADAGTTPSGPWNAIAKLQAHERTGIWPGHSLIA
jgi:hypothetical protein